MKLPRFHLSTLLLLCVFCGAVMGLCLRDNVWRPDTFLSYGDTEPASRILPSTFTFNLETTRVLAFRDHYVYVFDLASRKLLWKKPSGAESILDVQLQKDGTVVNVSGVTRDFDMDGRMAGYQYCNWQFNEVGDEKSGCSPTLANAKFNDSVRTESRNGNIESQ